jgi:hypothetical protein
MTNPETLIEMGSSEFESVSRTWQTKLFPRRPRWTWNWPNGLSVRNRKSPVVKDPVKEDMETKNPAPGGTFTTTDCSKKRPGVFEFSLKLNTWPATLTMEVRSATCRAAPSLWLTCFPSGIRKDSSSCFSALVLEVSTLSSTVHMNGSTARAR